MCYSFTLKLYLCFRGIIQISIYDKNSTITTGLLRRPLANTFALYCPVSTTYLVLSTTYLVPNSNFFNNLLGF